MTVFKNKFTEDIADGVCIKGYAKDLIKKAMLKIISVRAAENINELLYPPSNRLEKLHGDRKGQYSIRVNDKYRICFDWVSDHAENIEFVDYH